MPWQASARSLCTQAIVALTVFRREVAPVRPAASCQPLFAHFSVLRRVLRPPACVHAAA